MIYEKVAGEKQRHTQNFELIITTQPICEYIHSTERE